MTDDGRDGEYSVPPAAIRAFGPDDFLRALGAALLAWQAVEEATFKLFHRLLRVDDVNISGAVFFTPDSFGLRLKIVGNLMRSTIRDQATLDCRFRALVKLN